MKNTCYYLIRTFRCLIKFRNTLRTWQTACISMFLEHKTLSVDRQLVSAIRMQIEKNREKLLSILKTVFFVEDTMYVCVVIETILSTC